MFFLVIGALCGGIGPDPGEFKDTADEGFFDDEQLDTVAGEVAGAAGEEAVGAEQVIAAAFEGDVMEEDDGAGEGECDAGEGEDGGEEEDRLPLELVVVAEPFFGLGAEAG